LGNTFRVRLFRNDSEERLMRRRRRRRLCTGDTRLRVEGGEMRRRGAVR
jgi:hypothetical protein